MKTSFFYKDICKAQIEGHIKSCSKLIKQFFFFAEFRYFRYLNQFIPRKSIWIIVKRVFHQAQISCDIPGCLIGCQISPLTSFPLAGLLVQTTGLSVMVVVLAPPSSPSLSKVVGAVCWKETITGCIVIGAVVDVEGADVIFLGLIVDFT